MDDYDEGGVMLGVGGSLAIPALGLTLGYHPPPHLPPSLPL